jgi:uncharacterized protein (DUF58 family)
MVEKGSIRAEQYLAPETLSQLAPFELRAKMIVEGVMNGMHRSPYQGLAVEFAEHRQYVPGDETRHLDWKVFGRTDKLYLKQYQQETNLDVVLLVDASGSMRYGSLGGKTGWGGTMSGSDGSTWTKYDHATATSAALAHLCLQQRDRIGLATFSEEIRSQVKRSNNRDQWRSIVRILSQDPVERGTNLVKVADQVLSSVTNRALFFILSDFMSDPSQLREALARFRHKRHDVVLVQVLDHREINFDFDETAPFIGLEGEGQIQVDARSVRESYLDVFSRHQEEIRTAARGFGFDFELVDSHQSVGPPLARLFARRSAISRRNARG